MDGRAFALLIEPHQRSLHLHCYRMLGSLHDADDALQETLMRAWKGSDRYQPRARLSGWLHTIATNVCLTAIARRHPQPAAVEDLDRLQPYPDRLLDDLVTRESVELAFITAIQLLPPKQRAVLILRDVLGWSAKEAAEALGDSVGAVTSALQRARLGVERAHPPASAHHSRASTARSRPAPCSHASPPCASTANPNGAAASHSANSNDYPSRGTEGRSQPAISFGGPAS